MHSHTTCKDAVQTCRVEGLPWQLHYPCHTHKTRHMDIARPAQQTEGEGCYGPHTPARRLTHIHRWRAHRQAHTHSHPDTHRHRHRQIQTDTETDRDRQRQIDNQTLTQMKTNRHTQRHRQTRRQTARQTDSQTDSQTDTDRQTDRHARAHTREHVLLSAHSPAVGMYSASLPSHRSGRNWSGLGKMAELM